MDNPEFFSRSSGSTKICQVLISPSCSSDRPFPTTPTAQPRILTPHAGRSRNRARETWIGRGDGLTHRPEAGLSPGNVYRRFADKDALMRAVFRPRRAVNKVELAREVDVGQVRKVGIRTFTQQWIAGMLSAYRARAGLMRATVLYAQQHERTPFVRHQRDLEVQNFRKWWGLS